MQSSLLSNYGGSPDFQIEGLRKWKLHVNVKENTVMFYTCPCDCYSWNWNVRHQL